MSDRTLENNASYERLIADLRAALAAATARADTLEAAHAERSEKVSELQHEYDVLDAHHHKYATWAGHEWLRAVNRGDTYRARALGLLRQLQTMRLGIQIWEGTALGIQSKLTAAEHAASEAISAAELAEAGAIQARARVSELEASVAHHNLVIISLDLDRRTAEADASRARVLLARAIETDWNEDGAEGDDLRDEIVALLAAGPVWALAPLDSPPEKADDSPRE